MCASVPDFNSPAAQSAESTPTQPRRFTAEEEALLRESLRRCSPATLEAALQFRRTGSPDHIPCILIGIIERFVEPDLRHKLKEGDDDLRLVEDLGVDSLTMMEIVIMAEGALQMSINNDELRALRTLGDIKVFIDCRARGLQPPTPVSYTSIESLTELMPVQHPFLLLGEASVASDAARGKYHITGQEFFLQGHFKGNPIMPASLMLESLGQLALVHVLQMLPVEAGKVVNPAAVFFTGCEGVRAHRLCRPGDVLSLSVKLRRHKYPLATYEGTIRVGQEKAVLAEEITLSYAVMDKPVSVA